MRSASTLADGGSSVRRTLNAAPPPSTLAEVFAVARTPGHAIASFACGPVFRARVIDLRSGNVTNGTGKGQNVADNADVFITPKIKSWLAETATAREVRLEGLASLLLLLALSDGEWSTQP